MSSLEVGSEKVDAWRVCVEKDSMGQCVRSYSRVFENKIAIVVRPCRVTISSHADPNVAQTPSSFAPAVYRLMKPSSFPFFAFGSFFFGYILDVTKWTYHIRTPNMERPKMTRNSVMTGRPSACTERSAAGVRIGASHSKAILYVFAGRFCVGEFASGDLQWCSLWKEVFLIYD